MVETHRAKNGQPREQRQQRRDFEDRSEWEDAPTVGPATFAQVAEPLLAAQAKRLAQHWPALANVAVPQQSLQDSSSLAQCLARLRDQAEQLTHEPDDLEKETQNSGRNRPCENAEVHRVKIGF